MTAGVTTALIVVVILVYALVEEPIVERLAAWLDRAGRKR